MAVTQDNPAPYAPASVILDLIDRCRNRGLPSPVDSEVLGRAGVSDSLIPRTLQALRVLELISEDGQHTETFEGIRKTPEPQYKERLSEWLKGVYADVFSYVDPAEDDDTAIRDAFRSYNPVGQQPRMVTLFVGLCSGAGLLPEKTQQPRPARQRSSRPSPKATQGHTTTKKPSGSRGASTDLPQPLSGLLASLPQEGEGWTTEDREKFTKTFSAVLDYCFPIVEAKAPEDDSREKEDQE